MSEKSFVLNLGLNANKPGSVVSSDGNPLIIKGYLDVFEGVEGEPTYGIAIERTPIIKFLASLCGESADGLELQLIEIGDYAHITLLGR